MPTLIAILMLAFPLLEIAVFVLVGGEIGVLPTIGLIVLSGMVGAFLLRWQGFGAMQRIRREVEQGGTPGRELAHGAMIMLAGILLLIPGFISDVFGLLLFIPAVRDAAWRFFSSRITVVTGFSAGARGFGRPGNRDRERTIDLDEDEYTKTPDPNSPWRRPEIE
ncbi:FxsA family protein [Mesorhizobium sp. 1B3]|uniref:FxsA family protein n=1 Tax=Mesorhizobium sp. 1B3 TaxID=3243599 RepID=UPI003D9726A5